MGGYKDLDEFGFDPGSAPADRGKWYTVPRLTRGRNEADSGEAHHSGVAYRRTEKVEDALTILGASRDEESGELELAGCVAEMIADNMHVADDLARRPDGAAALRLLA